MHLSYSTCKGQGIFQDQLVSKNALFGYFVEGYCSNILKIQYCTCIYSQKIQTGWGLSLLHHSFWQCFQKCCKSIIDCNDRIGKLEPQGLQQALNSNKI